MCDQVLLFLHDRRLILQVHFPCPFIYISCVLSCLFHMHLDYMTHVSEFFADHEFQKITYCSAIHDHEKLCSGPGFSIIVIVDHKLQGPTTNMLFLWKLICSVLILLTLKKHLLWCPTYNLYSSVYQLHLLWCFTYNLYSSVYQLCCSKNVNWFLTLTL